MSDDSGGVGTSPSQRVSLNSIWLMQRKKAGIIFLPYNLLYQMLFCWLPIMAAITSVSLLQWCKKWDMVNKVVNGWKNNRRLFLMKIRGGKKIVNKKSS